MSYLSEVIEPDDRPLYHPSLFTEISWRSYPVMTPRNDRLYLQKNETLPDVLAVVSFVQEDSRYACSFAQTRPIQKFIYRRRIVLRSRVDSKGEWNSTAVKENGSFGTDFISVDGREACFFPPKGALTWEESMLMFFQSIPNLSSYKARDSSHAVRNIPCLCQIWK
jgi:hypothetical protein